MDKIVRSTPLSRPELLDLEDYHQWATSFNALHVLLSIANVGNVVKSNGRMFQHQGP